MSKLARSLAFLKLRPDQAKVFVAGNYWGVDAETMTGAKSLGYGTIAPNGKDLEICYEPRAV